MSTKTVSTKTNATRICASRGIHHKVLVYDGEDGALGGRAVASKLGLSAREIFKTLVALGASRQVYVFVIPVAGELNLKEAARAVGEKSIQMLPLPDLRKVTGYVKGGCSPIGMRRQYPTVFDESITRLEIITFNAGKVGLQLQIPVACLEEVVPYTVAAVTQFNESDDAESKQETEGRR